MTATDTISITDAASQIRTGKQRNSVITIHCNCEVYYDGRARSDLHGGDRQITLKSDGTVLVHGPDGYKPRNWLTPGSSTTVSVQENTLSIEGRSTTGEGVEELTITISTIYDLMTRRLIDGREKELTGTEADLKARLVDDPDLIEDGFRVSETEWETDAGPVDIYGFDTDGVPVLVELKRRQIDPDAVHQLQRYMQVTNADRAADASIRGILIAPTISDRAEALVEEHGFEFKMHDPRRKISGTASTLDQFQ